MKFTFPFSVSILLSLFIGMLNQSDETLSIPDETQLSAPQNAKVAAPASVHRPAPFINHLNEPAAPLNQGTTALLAPIITATKTDQLITDNGSTGATPGDVIEYTVTIANTGAGATDATGVNFTDTVDPNTTLVPGSVKSAPIAVKDAYSTVGNVSISVPAASGLTTNDVNLDGDVLNVTAVDQTGTEGQVTFNANGSFTFNPNPGFTGTTTFTYTVNDGTFNSTGTVTITITGMVWFIDDNATAPGDGRLGSAFSSIANFNSIAADDPNDNIFLYSGSYSSAGFTLLNGQNLIGQGTDEGTLASLAGVTFSVHPPISGSIPTTGGTNPTIAHNAATITTGQNNDIYGVTINNTGGTAFIASNFGTLKVRDVILSNSNGQGINFNNGALDVIIQSITASNSTNAISVTTTTGSFQVTGTGTTDGSGGTLTGISGRGIDLRNATNITLKNMTLTSANTTSDGAFPGTCDETNVLGCFAAIYMDGVSTITLDNIDIGGTEEHGIMGNSVSNLTMTNCTSTNNGDDNEENALKFRNLTGTCSITGSTFQNSAFRICHIINTAGNVNLTVNNCTFNNSAASPVGQDCFEMRTQGSATATVALTNSTFSRARSKGIQVFAEGNSTMNLNITGCRVERFGGAMAGIEVGSNGAGSTINYNINDNPVIESSSEVAALASTLNSTLNGRLNRNLSIDNNYPLAGGSIFAIVRVLHEGSDVAKVEMKGNPSVTGNNLDLPVNFVSVNGTNAAHRLDAILDNNVVVNDATGGIGIEGIYLRVGIAAAGGKINTLCGDITRNQVTVPASAMGRAFRANEIDASSILTLSGTGPVATMWTGNSNLNTNGAINASAGVAFTGVAPPGCNAPSHPTARIAAEPLAIIEKDRPEDAVAQVQEEVKSEPDTMTSIPGPSKETNEVEEAARRAVVLSGETVTVGGMGGFLLPAGQNIIIKFQVTINSSLPLGTCQLSNQGTVSGGNFSNVLTDDTDAAGLANPTVTTLSTMTLGNLVFKDNDKNNTFGGGDVGIVGVTVNLYRDNGTTSGTLDATDAFVTTTTTGGGGLYSFPNLCSGNYIVQIPSTEFGSGQELFGLISSPPTIAPDPNNNIDNDDNGQDAINSSIASQAITLDFNASTVEVNNSLDFGFRTPTLVTINDVTLNEGSGGGTTTFTFTVNRDNISDAFSLDVNTAVISPNNGDYTAIVGGTVSFTAGGNPTASVTVTVNADDVVELNETFNVLLSGATYGIIISDGTGLGTITNDDQATLSINSVSNAEGNSGITPYTFTVTSDKAVDVPFTVNVGTVDGTATTADGDYVASSSTLNFAGTAGEPQTFMLIVNRDTKVEPTETFTVPLSTVSASGRNVVISGSNGTGTGTITNDDAATISINDVSLVEGNAGITTFLFNVTLDGVVSTPITVNFTTANGTAGAGDYNTNSGTVTFPANGTGQTQTITVEVLGDLVGEANETFNVNLTSIQGSPPNISFADAQGLGTILDDDLSFSINDVTLDEGNAGTTNMTFTVTRTSTATAETIQYATADNTATTGDNDYTGSSGTLNFAIGDNSETITVVFNGDTKVELNETFFVNLSNPSNGSIGDGQGIGTLTNDDQATLTISNVSNTEGNAGTQVYTFTVSADNAVDVPYSVNVGTVDVTATAGTDYLTNTATLNFAGTAGESKTFDVTVNGDLLVEATETFTVPLTTLSAGGRNVVISGSSGTGTGTITNNDAAVISITADVSQSEATTPQTFSVTLSNPVDVAVTVQIATTDVTTSAADFSLATTSITFPANSTTAQNANVNIINDNIVEADETYTLSLGTITAPGRDVTPGTSLRTGTIQNDDATTVTLTPVGSVSQNEGNSGNTPFTFRATLTNAVQGGFTLNYNTNDGTATAGSDYTDNDNSLTFIGNAGEFHDITVNALGELVIENDETFTVLLGAITAATPVQTAAISIAGTNPQTGTILNDELDWGDAPTAAQSGFAGTYPTILANNGARHSAALGGLRLGATIDGDLDGQPTASANGDGADDDGVTLPAAFITNTTASITVNASATAKLDAWVDFNRDGDWDDAGENIFNNTALAPGNNSLTFAVPAGASVGTSFARFRVSTAGGLSTTGLASDGEVEDYQVTILDNQYSISSPTVTEGSAPGTVNLNFVISRTTTTGNGSVNYSVPTGTATSGSDYAAISAGIINFTNGGNPSETVTVVVNGDAIVEDNETVIITLSNPINGGISTAVGTGTITNDDQATLTLSGGIAQNEGTGSNTLYTFTATLSAPVQGGFQVAYTTNDATAVSASDYTDNDGSLSFTGTAGETKTWTVDVIGDNTVELNETFTAVLGAVSMTSVIQAAAISLAGSPQTATIQNDDAAIVSIAASVSQPEATTPQTFSVTLSNPVDVPVTLQFTTADNTATTGDIDYTAVNQTVTFTANTTTAQSVNVPVSNDNKVEADEVFNVTIGTLAASGRSVSLGTATATGTILNDDLATVTLSIVGPASQNEGNTGNTPFTFRATLNNPVQAGFSLAYSANDITATAGSDYTDNDNSLTFAGTAGEFHDITVNALGELVIENDETFTVTLGAVSGTTAVQMAAIGTAGSPQTVTILNDELDWGDAPDPTYPTLSANTGANHALAPGGLRLGMTVDADLDGQPNPTASGDGTDEDGVSLPSALVLNTSASISVNASANGLLNAWVDFNADGDWNDMNEQIFTNQALTAGANALSFSVPAGASVGTSFARFRLSTASGLASTGLAPDGEVEDYQVNIVNTQFSINDVSVTEGNAGTANLTFTVSRTVNANACSVQYSLSGGTATSGSDYQLFTDGVLSFTAGGAFSQTVTVVVNGDNIVELDETVLMTLSNPVNASILDGSGTGTIQNDDAAVITATNPNIAEGSTGTSSMSFDITLSQPSDANVVINYTTVDATATTADNDYQNTSGTLTFAPGETSKTVAVTVNGDCNVEPNETLLLRLSSLNANGRTVTLSGGGATLDATGTIVNTPRPTATISGTVTLCQGAPAAVITFTGSGGTAPYTFTYSVNGGGTQSVTTLMGNSVTVSQGANAGGIFTYTLLSVSDVNCSQTQSGTATITVFGKPTFTLSVLGQTLLEGNTQTLCDTDADPTNPLQFNITTACAAGSLVWRTQISDGNWSAWSSTVPASQPSDNITYRYQAACDANCPSTFTGIISLTIDYRASTPQNVSLVADGTTVAAGESKTICDIAGNALIFSATCVSGEILLYSVDGGEYSTAIPLQIADGNFHNYRVRCRKANGTPSCAETESAPMSLKITTAGPSPTVSITPLSGCGTPTTLTGISSCGASATIWFNATTNTALPSLPSTTPSATTSYYARCQNEAGCLSAPSNTVTFTITPVNEPPTVSASADIVCTGTTVTVSANCPAGSSTFWNTGVTESSFQVAFNNVTKQTYWAKCIFPNGCQSPESVQKSIFWKAFELTFINIGQSQSAIKPANDRNLWASQFITPDAGPVLENSTEANPTIYHSEKVNKTAPRFWTIQVQTCALGTNGSVTYDLLASPEVGVVRSYNTHENNAPYLMYANREGFTELYAQNHPAYGFYQDNGSGGNTYDEGLPKGLYKLGVRYWDQKGQGSIYPSTRQPAGNVLAYQEYWFRIQSQNGIGTGAVRQEALVSDNGFFAQVAPNPVSKTLHLKVSEAKGQKVNVSLLDAAGRVMMQRAFVPETNQHQEEFEVSDVANGMYFMQVKTADKQATLKVVKVE